MDRILAISSIFPNQYEPRKGIFNLQLFKLLAQGFSLRVVVPVPFFPGTAHFPEIASSGRVKGPMSEGNLGGLSVTYPRYLSIPRIGRTSQGFLYYIFTRRTIRRLAESHKARAIYVSWAYPDGFACCLLAKELGIPVLVETLGSDINEFTKAPARRKLILRGLNNADRVITVSRALKERLIELGVDDAKTTVVYRGVDTTMFHPTAKEAARRELGLNEGQKHILYVGNLTQVKGPDYLIEAFALSPFRNERHLYLVGFGAMRKPLERMINSLSLNQHVHMLGERDHLAISRWMNACDILVVPSLSEGVPNVILESFACGTPVVATSVGGIPEVVTSQYLGMLVSPKDAKALAEAIDAALTKRWDQEQISQYASNYSWSSRIEELKAVIKDVIEHR